MQLFWEIRSVWRCKPKRSRGRSCREQCWLQNATLASLHTMARRFFSYGPERKITPVKKERKFGMLQVDEQTMR